MYRSYNHHHSQFQRHFLLLQRRDLLTSLHPHVRRSLICYKFVLWFDSGRWNHPSQCWFLCKTIYDRMCSELVHVVECGASLPLLGWTTFCLLCSADIWMVSSFLVWWIVYEFFVEHITFNPFEYIPRSRIAGSCGSSVFAEYSSYWGPVQTVSHHSFPILYFHQRRVSVYIFSPHPLQQNKTSTVFFPF